MKTNSTLVGIRADLEKTEGKFNEFEEYDNQ